jgi:hypothetical protein
MKKIILNSLLIFATLFASASSLNASEQWKEHWVKSQDSYKAKDAPWALCEIMMALGAMTQQELYENVWVFIDRANIYYALDRYEDALDDADYVLSKNNITKIERERALLARIFCLYKLKQYDEVNIAEAELERVHGAYPIIEDGETYIIIRNVPECDCYKKMMSTIFLKSGVCESEKDITFSNGIGMIKKKVTYLCQQEKDSIATCKKWCDEVADGAIGYCNHKFGNFACLLVCQQIVKGLKNGCYWCCQGKGFYQNCVEPFKDILQYMGENCNPDMD